MDLAAKGSLAKVWRGLDGVGWGRPGGRCDGRILRVAEADTDFGFCRLISSLRPTLLSPARGWPYCARRAVHGQPPYWNFGSRERQDISRYKLDTGKL